MIRPLRRLRWQLVHVLLSSSFCSPTLWFPFFSSKTADRTPWSSSATSFPRYGIGVGKSIEIYISIFMLLTQRQMQRVEVVRCGVTTLSHFWEAPDV